MMVGISQRRPRLLPRLMAVGSSFLGLSGFANAADSGSSGVNAVESGNVQLEEIVVTARKRTEKLQDVPDAITPFTAAMIENAGIEHIADFMALTPNLTFEDGSPYYSGFINLSMRGIGNAQDGWPSVAYIVDGVPADSLDAINSGSLEDIERIEVLRGPQSALYGAGAIAGAINVVTQAPTNDYHFKARVSYGNGNDRQIAGTASGPIISDTLLFRVSAIYRDDDGLFTSPSNGLDLGFMHQREISGRLIYKPADDLQIDVRARFDKEHNGSTYEDEVPSIAYENDFNPIYNARRGYAGFENRDIYNLSTRIQYDFSAMSLISVTGFSHIDQNIGASFCFDDPSDPLLPGPDGGAQCILGSAFGDRALPGEALDEFGNSVYNFRTYTEDLRLASRAQGPLNWVVGASGMYREAIEGFAGGIINAPDHSLTTEIADADIKRDNWWGLYGQISDYVTSKIELTFAGRYDHTNVKNTGYTDLSLMTIAPVPGPNGLPENTQLHETSAFQPKGQVSYHFTGDVMSYFTVSRGFRAGFYNSGQYTLPEHTTNYELGLKSTLLDQRMTANLAVFYIDYSDQQFEVGSATYPYIIATTIPKTKIKGVEYEGQYRISTTLTVGFAAGYLDAMVSDGTRSPAAPKFNLSPTLDYAQPITDGTTLHLHVDDRYNSSLYLSTGDTQFVSAKNYLNARLGVDHGHFSYNLFVRNAQNTRQAIAPGEELIAGFLRYPNMPRTYGGEIRMSY
jgi:iron complex outermembrane recepter protein